MLRRPITFLLVAQLTSACAGDGSDDDHDHDHDHENEIISRVILTLTAAGDGSELVFEFNDPDGDGGASGSADAIELPVGQMFGLDVQFLNGLVDPPEDLSAEIAEEAEEHLVLVLGEGVSGPASNASPILLTHAYDDLESDYGANAVGDDLPVGLRSTIDTRLAGAGTLRVVLRHLPELNGSPQKTDTLLEAAAAGETLPGTVDADVSFELTVR